MQKIWLLILGLVALGCVSTAQEKKAEPAKAPQEFKHSSVQPSPEWDRIKSLAGDWDSTAGSLSGTSIYKITGAGSAVMMTIPSDKPGDEMITMFHPDGKNILVTHYCSAMNQPRMKLVPSSNANELRFKFLDATNLADSSYGHMHELALIFDGPDHHVQEWTFISNGKLMTEKFDLRRKK